MNSHFASLCIDGTLVLTMSNRVDRQERISSNLKKHRIDFEFLFGETVNFEDLRPEQTKGFEMKDKGVSLEHYAARAHGRIRSGIAAMKIADAGGWRNLLLLEDDAILHDGFEQLLHAAVLEAPADFHALYLSCYNYKPAQSVPGCNHLKRVVAAWHDHAVIWSPVGRTIAANLLMTANTDCDDYMSRHLHPLGKSFYVNPMVAEQGASYSDLRCKPVAYGTRG